MLKKKKFIPHDKPIFREVIPQALKFAWTHPSHWVLGIFAAVLFSGGALDIFLKFWNAVQKQGNEIFIGNTISNLWRAAEFSSVSVPWIMYIKAVLAIAFFLIIIAAIVMFSCACQGALVHAIGTYKTNKQKSLKSALHVGGKAIIPIAVLNLIFIFIIWIARFGVSYPLSLLLGNDSVLFTVIYILAFMIFAALILGLGVLQIYALNAIILQDAPLAAALERGWKMIREHWLVTIETIIVQSVTIIALAAVAAIVALILTFPAIVLFVFSYISLSINMFYFSIILFFIITISFALFTTGFTVAFQYATWTMMYHKFGEGGVVPKIHRIFKTLFKS
jgi:hypothetical protein